MVDSLVSLNFRLFGKQPEKRSKIITVKSQVMFFFIIILCVLLTAYFTPDCGCLSHRPEVTYTSHIARTDIAVLVYLMSVHSKSSASDYLAALVLMNPVHVLRRPRDDVMTSERCYNRSRASQS